MAVSFVCPKGDQSDDADYCSVCGIKMDGAPSAAAADPSIERCPSCGIQRKNGARFCETCRYDFRSPTANAPATPTARAAKLTPVTNSPDAAIGEGAATNIADDDVALEPVAATTPPTPPMTVAPRYWEAIIEVDPVLDVEPDPDTPCPADTPQRTFPLDLAENLVGRRSASRGILPSIALSDPGVSHRHLMVYRNPDATLMVSDLGSTNGTFLNDSSDRLEAGVKTPVADGDHVELGRWTRMTFRRAG
jgi:hypothetical protein